MTDSPQKDYESEIIDIDDIESPDLKINPDFYMHKALLACQECLLDKDIKEGFVRYEVVVRHLELLARAAGKLPSDYEEKLKEYKDTKEVQGSDYRQVLIHQKKLELILKLVFNSKAIITTLPG